MKISNPKPDVKIEIFAPPEAEAALREALAQAGAGVIGDYDHCATVTPVKGYFRPLPGADPYSGVKGEISQVEEVKIEAVCRREQLDAVDAAIRKAHPYEEPVILYLPLIQF
jgi:hypothetical protein